MLSHSCRVNPVRGCACPFPGGGVPYSSPAAAMWLCLLQELQSRRVQGPNKKGKSGSPAPGPKGNSSGQFPRQPGGIRGNAAAVKFPCTCTSSSGDPVHLLSIHLGCNIMNRTILSHQGMWPFSPRVLGRGCLLKVGRVSVIRLQACLPSLLRPPNSPVSW